MLKTLDDLEQLSQKEKTTSVSLFENIIPETFFDFIELAPEIF
jgi:hypothetical protein